MSQSEPAGIGVSVGYLRLLKSAANSLATSLSWSLDLLGVHGLETVESDGGNVVDDGEEFLGGILIFVTLADNSDADSSGDVTDTVQPDGLVELVGDFDFLTSMDKFN